MSDSWLQFIPADPWQRPSPEAAARARALLASFAPAADAVDVAFKNEVEFFAPGENWSGVACPACGADLEDWWNEAMNTAYGNAFEDLAVATPCCGAATSLNDLNYVWPAGFGRFVLEAMNPDIGDTTPEQDRRLAECLGLPLRKIHVRI